MQRLEKEVDCVQSIYLICIDLKKKKKVFAILNSPISGKKKTFTTALKKQLFTRVRQNIRHLFCYPFHHNKELKHTSDGMPCIRLLLAAAIFFLFLYFNEAQRLPAGHHLFFFLISGDWKPKFQPLVGFKRICVPNTSKRHVKIGNNMYVCKI